MADLHLSVLLVFVECTPCLLATALPSSTWEFIVDTVSGNNKAPKHCLATCLDITTDRGMAELRHIRGTNHCILITKHALDGLIIVCPHIYLPLLQYRKRNHNMPHHCFGACRSLSSCTFRGKGV